MNEREALELAVQAMRAPLDDWKGELERKALDAARAVMAQPEREPDCWQVSDFDVLRADAERLRNERAVLARWMAEALGAAFFVEEDAEDGGESLRMLRERGERLVRAVLGIDADRTTPGGPQCNLKTPWLAPDSDAAGGSAAPGGEG